MQTLDISKAVCAPKTYPQSGVAVSTAATSSSGALSNMTLVAVPTQDFLETQKLFQATTDDTASVISVRFEKLSEEVHRIISGVKAGSPGREYQLKCEAIEKLLCVVSAANTGYTYEDIAAEIQLQSEELARLQAQVEAKDSEIARLVALAHKPVIIDGKRKISLRVRTDGSISCS